MLDGGGYRTEPSDSLSLMVLNLPVLLGAILRRRQPGFPHGWEPTFHLTCTAGNYRFHPVTDVRVVLVPDVVVEPAASVAAGAVHVSTDLSTVSDIVFRRDSFDAARAAGRIQVAADDEQDARTLFNLLVLKAPWYTPNADGR